MHIKLGYMAGAMHLDTEIDPVLGTVHLYGY